MSDSAVPWTEATLFYSFSHQTLPNQPSAKCSTYKHRYKSVPPLLEAGCSNPLSLVPHLWPHSPARPVMGLLYRCPTSAPGLCQHLAKARGQKSSPGSELCTYPEGHFFQITQRSQEAKKPVVPCSSLKHIHQQRGDAPWGPCVILHGTFHFPITRHTWDTVNNSVPQSSFHSYSGLQAPLRRL